MNEAVCVVDAIRAVGDKAPAPFATVYVTLTKQEHIQLVMDANTWKGLHRRAKERAQLNERRHRHEMLKAAELAHSRQQQLQQ